MKRKRLNSYTWRKRGHRKRFTESSIQDDKYTPAADAIINRNSLRKVRPFARNTPLDKMDRPKYGMVSVEKQQVELRFREVTIATKAFGHYPEHWHCEWLAGKPDSAHSVRLFFYGSRAVLVRYDRGVFERSPEYSSRNIALKSFDLYSRGKRINWRSIDVPLDQIEPGLDGKRFGPSTKPLPIKGLHKPWRCKGCDGTDCVRCKEEFILKLRST